MTHNYLINECYSIVKDYYKNQKKTLKWFETPLPQFSYKTPLQIIKSNHVKQLHKFILRAIETTGLQL